MLYHSTNKSAPLVDFQEAAIKGQAPDKGLYFPEQIPQLPAEFLTSFHSKSKAEIAFEVIRTFVGASIDENSLYHICEETVSFDFPLVRINDTVSSLELFHGPTLAFKDVGARFMSRCLGYFSKSGEQKVTVLVATSGDTGSAVANGFLGVEGVDVVILYPSGKVSKVQELQLTTLGQNITALEVAGTFDDCQAMVKQAFSDEELNQKLFLTSANSINVARWLPQQFYYFYALQQWNEKQAPVVCVPSGNFGNICAGLMAYKTGLPVKHFIAACNSNNSFTEYLHSGNFASKQAVATISNAMDVGNPSNFIRIIELFGNDFESLKSMISSSSISDDETSSTITRVFKEEDYLLDPHGAVAFAALERYQQNHSAEKGIILETAHPVKFSNVVESLTNTSIEVPHAVKYILNKEKKSILTEAKYEALKEYLMKSAS